MPHKWSVVLVAVTLGLTSCGLEDSATPQVTPLKATPTQSSPVSPEATPTAPAAATTNAEESLTPQGLESGETGVILSVSTGSSDSRLGNLSWSRRTGATILFVPTSGRAIELSRHNSPEYAKNRVSLNRSEDRVFQLRKWSGGRLEVREFDIATGAALQDMMISDAEDGSVAVIDDMLYCRTESGPYLMRPWGSSGSQTVEVPGAETPWGLWTDGAALFSLTKDEGRLLFERFDPPTGQSLGVIGDFTSHIDHLSEPNSWEFAVDNGSIYWSSLKLSSRSVVLWSYREGDAEPAMVAESPSTSFEYLNALDVDDGHYLVLGEASGSGGDFALLYDQTRDTWQSVELGLSIVDGVIVHLD